jgi:TM2 domain-containing membrane protein YozV
MKNPQLAFLYSFLLPGAGQLYLGERVKGWTFFCMDAGVAVSLVFSHTAIAWFLMGGIYLAILIPAALDAFQTASGRPRAFTGDSIPYVIMMLFMVGPFAIPLLWQSAKFSKTAKIVWTAGVILIALLAIAALTLSASFLEQFLQQGGAV